MSLNDHSITEGINKPFLLKPVAKDYLWGGTRLNDEFSLGIDVYPFAEAWVCSTHPDGESGIVFTNETLIKVIENHPEYLGSHVLQLTDGRAELPILIKLIDAKSDLSVQVHPDDEYALKYENSRGKTEMWYVLDAGPGAELIYGFNRDVDKNDLIDSINTGNINELLNHLPVYKNDLYLINSGTVHAIGAGCLIAEIQQSSNLTYRLYDYDRVDKYGRKRELHLEKALEVADLKSSVSPRQPMRLLRYRNGCASELLARCKYFQVERFLINTEERKLADFQTGKNSFHALLCIDGCGVLYGDEIMLPFFKGDCIFVPANSISMKMHGQAQLLNVSC